MERCYSEPRRTSPLSEDPGPHVHRLLPFMRWAHPLRKAGMARLSIHLMDLTFTTPDSATEMDNLVPSLHRSRLPQLLPSRPRQRARPPEGEVFPHPLLSSATFHVTSCLGLSSPLLLNHHCYLTQFRLSPNHMPIAFWPALPGHGPLELPKLPSPPYMHLHLLPPTQLSKLET